MVGWHHQLNGHEFQQTLGDGEGDRSLAGWSPWSHQELDRTEWLNNNGNIPLSIHHRCICQCVYQCIHLTHVKSIPRTPQVLWVPLYLCSGPACQTVALLRGWRQSLFYLFLQDILADFPVLIIRPDTTCGLGTGSSLAWQESCDHPSVLLLWGSLAPGPLVTSNWEQHQKGEEYSGLTEGRPQMNFTWGHPATWFPPLPSVPSWPWSSQSAYFVLTNLSAEMWFTSLFCLLQHEVIRMTHDWEKNCNFFGHIAGLWDVSLPTKDQTWAPVVKAPSPNHWTVREFPANYFFFFKGKKKHIRN